MELAALAEYAASNIEPLVDGLGQPSYRCAARLKDGLYLPCIVLESLPARVDLAIRRFEETIAENKRGLLGGKPKFRGFTYRDMVRTFATNTNQLTHYDIESVEPSSFAIPVARLAEVKGETSMAWTQFTGTMQDGREFTFGTTFLMEFFQMPAGYVGTDVTAIESHKKSSAEIYRERPYFRCFVDGL